MPLFSAKKGLPSHVVASIYTRRAMNREAKTRANIEARREATADAHSERRKKSARVAESRLLDQIERMERHPSPAAAHRLRAMAADPKLPAAARAAAAAVVVRWTDDPTPRKIRNSRKDKSNG